MNCRENCGACCIAPSIASPIPGMPEGKPAGVRCVNLNLDDYRCAIWGTASYPAVCERFAPSIDVCGASQIEALELIRVMELHTSL
ncbi:YkgJ family cysteine cluster protein [Congregibacter sp.]|uniref:YkgJ family cysteine cluster protein n=1 Tax=Congregibacter sp. TaxID=2744308 RepID=UPI003F6B5E7B